MRRLSDVLYAAYAKRVARQLGGAPVPRHVGVLVDGNRRWAKQRGAGTEEGHRAGASAYWIDRAGYELPDLGLTANEREALQLAVAAVRVGGDTGGLALLKLGAGDVEGEAGPLVAALPTLPALPVLFDANGRRASVRFGYRGRPRQVDPYGLLTRDGFWYVVGLEHESGLRKTYRVDRIEGGPAYILRVESD